MNCNTVETNGRKYLHLTSSGPLFRSEQEALDIVALCSEHEANAVLLEGDSLSDDFVTLRTGLAGAALQKFGNYFITVAVALAAEQEFPPRFKELISELDKGSSFRVFTNVNDAANWLLDV